MKQQVYIETYGCQMNVYDTELIRSILTKADYGLTDTENNADVVFLNTCSVRDNANRKIYNRVHEIRNARKPKNVIIGVLGCMATNFRKKLLDDTGLKLDIIAGPDSYKHLPKLISEVADTGEKGYHATLSEFETYSDVYPMREGGVNAWIAVMRGCNNYCTFCVVPFTRGRERSREPQNIVEEVKRLVQDGFKQVTLLGQNVNSYKYEDYDFADLLKMVSDVDGIKRIRYTSPHPKDYPRKLLDVMVERDNICKQIHMPLQAGNTRVLDIMNRTYTKEEFLKLADDIREVMPDIALSTDVIVGFPTETEEEFEDTLDVMQRVRFDQAFMFKYSERPYTLASKRYKDQISEEEKTKRIVRLNEIQRQIQLEKNQAHIGQTHDVLIEEESSKKRSTEFSGRADNNKIVIIPASTDYKAGDIIRVKITEATTNVLKGMPC